MEPVKHIPDLLKRYSQFPQQEYAYNYWKEGVWTHFSSKEVLDYIECIALTLTSLGLKKGDRIGICGLSTPQWAMADFAIALAGGVTVPFFYNLSAEHFEYQVKQSKPRWIFIGDAQDLAKVKALSSEFEGIFAWEESGQSNGQHSFMDLVAKGAKIKKQEPKRYQQLGNDIQPNDLATIIYTSGSTGNPKGVELTHKNLTAIVHLDDFMLRPSDKYLSILPLAHIFAKQLHFIMTAWAVPVYWLNDLTQLSRITNEVPITRMICVPRLLEKAYAKIVQAVEDGSGIKKYLGKKAIELAHKEDYPLKSLFHPLLDRLVYSKFRKKFGPHFHSILCGGAPLNPHLHRFFLNSGICVLQGWGLTEGSTIAVNRIQHNKIGTVGPALEGVSFKISPHGELLAAGPTIMRGYYQNPEATKAAIDEAGWLHTGDAAHLDEDGHVIIEGRMNETFKTSQGEFVVPVPIEQELSRCPLIDMAMVVGQGFPYPAAILFPNLLVIEKMKKESGQENVSMETFLQSAAITKKVDDFIDQLNQKLDHWQEVRAWRFAAETPTIEGGELTPTMKLRRKVVAKKYADLISEMYAANGIVS